MRRLVSILALLLAAVGCWGCRAPLARYERVEPAMGTTFRLVFYATGDEAAERAGAAARERIHAIERIFSDYDAASEARRIAGAAPGVFDVSRELAEVTALAAELGARSGGAFDVTVGPLSRLWRRAGRQGEAPEQADWERAARAVGWHHLRVDAAARQLELRAPGMRLDYGGIAKGYAACEALRVLAEHGFERALVDAGGDVSCGAAPPGAAGWRVALEGAEQAGGGLVLCEASIATSGARYRGVELDGELYSHLLDPRRAAAPPGGGQVTVLVHGRGRGALADALASAVGLLALEEALLLVASYPGAEARLVGAGGPEAEGPQLRTTAGFPPLLSLEPHVPTARSDP
ncbi:MAG: FAD:protein FMN transferase [Planctomycetota bacterium]